MDIQLPISIDDVVIGPTRRELDRSAVNRLAESIEQIGLRHPITVREKGDKYHLIAGRHRLEACRKLGREHVPAIIVKMTNDEARLWEIAENLHRSDLTKLQRAEHIEEWRKLAEKLSHQARSGQSQHGGHNSEGVSKTAESLGVDRTTVKKARAIAGMTPEAKDAAREAGIDDNESKLFAVAKEEPAKQVSKVYDLKNSFANVRTWRDEFERLWAKGTEDDHAWARERIDKPIMDQRYA